MQLPEARHTIVCESLMVTLQLLEELVRRPVKPPFVRRGGLGLLASLAKGAEQKDKFGDVGCKDDQPKPNLGELVDEVGLARPGAVNQQSTDCNIANISVNENAPAMLGSAGDGVQEAVGVGDVRGHALPVPVANENVHEESTGVAPEDESEKFVKWAGASGEVLGDNVADVEVSSCKRSLPGTSGEVLGYSAADLEAKEYESEKVESAGASGEVLGDGAACMKEQQCDDSSSHNLRAKKRMTARKSREWPVFQARCLATGLLTWRTLQEWRSFPARGVCMVLRQRCLATLLLTWRPKRARV